jgi:hypothetical protein
MRCGLKGPSRDPDGEHSALTCVPEAVLQCLINTNFVREETAASKNEITRSFSE